MIGSWVVGAFIRFETNGVATMQRLAAASSAANTTFMRQQKQISASEAALANYQRRIESIRASLRSFTARAASVFAIGGAAGIADATNEAGKLQVNLIGVGNATAATAEQMKRLQGFAFDLGNITGQTPAQAATMIAQTARLVSGVQQFQARGGGFNVAAFQRLMTNDVAKFAVVQAYGRGMDINSAAVMGVKLAHMFQEFSPQGLHRMLGAATVVSELMPDKLDKLLTQAKYFVPIMKTLHVSNEQALATYALLDRYGMGTGRSGTSVARVIEQALGPLQLTSHSQIFHTRLLEQMGVIDASGRNKFFNRRTNQFDFLGFAEQLHKYSTKVPADTLVKQFTSVFGLQGVNLASLIANKDFTHNLDAIRNLERNKSIGLDEQYAKYHTAFLYNIRRDFTNAQAIMTELAWPWLTSFSNWADKLATRLHSFQAWLHANPDFEKRLGAVAAAITASAAGLGLYLGSQLVTLPFKINATAAAMQRLAIAIQQAGAAAGAAGGAGAAAGAAGVASRIPILGTLLLGGYAIYDAIKTDSALAHVPAATKTVSRRLEYLKNMNPAAYAALMGRSDRPSAAAFAAGGFAFPASFAKAVNAAIYKQQHQDIHIDNVHLHIDGDTKDAGRKFGSFLDGLRNPQRTLSTSGTIRTAPLQPAGMSIAGGAFGG